MTLCRRLLLISGGTRSAAYEESILSWLPFSLNSPFHYGGLSPRPWLSLSEPFPWDGLYDPGTSNPLRDPKKHCHGMLRLSMLKQQLSSPSREGDIVDRSMEVMPQTTYYRLPFEYAGIRSVPVLVTSRHSFESWPKLFHIA